LQMLIQRRGVGSFSNESSLRIENVIVFRARNSIIEIEEA
jgi:hypothetical protein